MQERGREEPPPLALCDADEVPVLDADADKGALVEDLAARCAERSAACREHQHVDADVDRDQDLREERALALDAEALRRLRRPRRAGPARRRPPRT